MSRRRATNPRELLLPSLIPDRHQTGVVFGLRAPSGPVAAIHGKMGDSSEPWAGHSTPHRVAKQASEATDAAIADLIAGNPLLARLVFQRIRPHIRSGVISQRSGSAADRQRSPATITPPDPATLLLGCTEEPFSAPIPPAIESLFTELAQRRLRNRATQDKR